MTRKTVPQPLTLAGSTAVDEQQYEHDFIDSPRSPLSLKSPKSPRSPFRFTRTKESQSELPSMQAAEYQTRSNLPPSQSSPSVQQYTAVGQENQEPAASKSRFFNNYKAAKSSSRLQNSESAASVTEDSMSRDTERPSMAGRVSSKEAKRTGRNYFFLPLRCHSLTFLSVNRIHRQINNPTTCRCTLKIRHLPRNPNRALAILFQRQQKGQAEGIQPTIQDKVNPR